LVVTRILLVSNKWWVRRFGRFFMNGLLVLTLHPRWCVHHQSHIRAWIYYNYWSKTSCCLRSWVCQVTCSKEGRTRQAHYYHSCIGIFIFLNACSACFLKIKSMVCNVRHQCLSWRIAEIWGTRLELGLPWQLCMCFLVALLISFIIYNPHLILYI
jgi:hypothetical protein